ncbi:hypothetical protein FRC00_011398 [Tulasnella sp. 408]|nr:hypothetical protein FRC00_011398 [Tulasnella sp. 408]
MPWRPPSDDAVAKAFSVLMASMSEENGRAFVSGDNNAYELLSSPELARNVHAVWLAQSCMVRKMDLYVARMQHQRNLTLPVHRLPLDVLALIFEEFPVWSPSKDTTSILDLLKVDHGWRTAILNLPELWTAFPLDLPPKLAPLVLARSKNLPLTLTYPSIPARKYLEDGEAQEHSQDIDEIETMELVPSPLGAALGGSPRWRKIDLTLSCGLYESAEELLEAPTPALEVLRVFVKYPASSSTMGPFTLAAGPPLKELALHRVITSWHSPRLVGLIKLDLGDTNSGPSTNQLLRILSNSPQLEHLSLTDLQPPAYGASSWSSGPVLLEHLKTLHVTRSANKYISALLESAQFPRCTSVQLWDGYVINAISDEDARIWSMGNEQTAAVLGLNMVGTERRRLNILIEWRGIRFKNQDSQLQEHFDLDICRKNLHLLLPLIEQFLTTWDPIPDVKLKVMKDAPLLSLSVWSPLLRSLHVRGSKHCRKALVELAKQSSPLGLGNASWICPELSELTLQYDIDDQEDDSRDIQPLYFLLNQRWSNTGSNGLSAPQLSSFTWRGNRDAFPTLWRLKAELKEILPSFRMLGPEL